MADNCLQIAAVATGGLVVATVVFILFSSVLSAKGMKPVATALYVFGDSTVDAGNNNFLNTMAKADFAPYGVDLKGQLALGRFTNGLTFADLIAEYLGLPPPPAFMSIKDEFSGNKIITGVNYASGASGILNHTGEAAINCFEKTVLQDLPLKIKTEDALKEHLGRSVILVSMAGNDYTLGYFFNPTMLAAKDPAAYTQLLVQSLTASIERLAKLGVKKFVVMGMPQIGCSTAFLEKNKGKCDEQVSKIISSYNSQLVETMDKSAKTWGIFFTRIVPEKIDIHQIAAETGAKFPFEPCCPVDKMGLCIKDAKPCENRDDHLIFDAIHPTEIYHTQIARKCFNGTGTCQPLNVLDLCRSNDE